MLRYLCDLVCKVSEDDSKGIGADLIVIVYLHFVCISSRQTISHIFMLFLFLFDSIIIMLENPNALQ